jgi:hypothetical protein
VSRKLALVVAEGARLAERQRPAAERAVVEQQRHEHRRLDVRRRGGRPGGGALAGRGVREHAPFADRLRDRRRRRERVGVPGRRGVLLEAERGHRAQAGRARVVDHLDHRGRLGAERLAPHRQHRARDLARRGGARQRGGDALQLREPPLVGLGARARVALGGLQPRPLGLRLPAPGHVLGDHADAEHRAVVAEDREPLLDPGVRHPRVGRRLPLEHDVAHRLAGLEHARQHRLRLLAERAEQVARAAAEVRLRGDAVERREPVVDAHPAQLAVEHAQPHRRRAVDGLQLGVAGAQARLGLVALVHVDERAHVAEQRAAVGEARHAHAGAPARGAVAAADPALDAERLAPRVRLAVRALDLRAVVGVHGRQPARAGRLLLRLPRVGVPGGVAEHAQPARVGQPEHDGRRRRDGAEAALALCAWRVAEARRVVGGRRLGRHAPNLPPRPRARTPRRAAWRAQRVGRRSTTRCSAASSASALSGFSTNASCGPAPAGGPWSE